MATPKPSRAKRSPHAQYTPAGPDGEDEITTPHLAEAIQYRSLGRDVRGGRVCRVVSQIGPIEGGGRRPSCDVSG